jgi:hypothetical protein
MTRSSARILAVGAACLALAPTMSRGQLPLTGYVLSRGQVANHGCGDDTYLTLGSEQEWGYGPDVLPVLSTVVSGAGSSLPACETPGTIFATASNVATWSSPAMGNVDFSNVAVSVQKGTGSAFLENQWGYTFIAAANGTFSMNGTISRRNGDPGLDFDMMNHGWSFGFTDYSVLLGGPIVTDFSEVTPLTFSWTFSASVTAGTQYGVFLDNLLNVDDAAFDRDYSNDVTIARYADADFDWTITSDQVSAAPEPATFLMLVPGIALVGLVRRRGRHDVSDSLS